MIKEIWNNIFGAKKSRNTHYEQIRLMNDFQNRYLNYSSNQYDNILYRACIDRISSQVAKLTPTIKGDLVLTDKYYANLDYLLKQKPNEYMNRYDFFYKLTSMLLDTNNVFVYKRVVNNQITGFYPINYSEIEVVDVESELYAKFNFKNSAFSVFLPFDELICIRRHYNEHEIFGSKQNDGLKPIFEVLKAIDTGLINSVELSTQLRGYIKYVGNLKKEDLDRFKDEFVSSYMNVGADKIGALDAKADFVPINLNPQTIDYENVKLVLENFSINFGVSENILKGSASENEMNAFYELVIEPLMTQFSLEFTNKVFTKQAIKEQNEIIFTGNKLLFASVATKTTLAKELMPAGIFSINDIREMYGYNPIENGDKHIMSLNYIDLDKANEYQVGENKDVKENNEQIEDRTTSD